MPPVALHWASALGVWDELAPARAEGFVNGQPRSSADNREVVCVSCLRSDLRKSSSCACAQYFCINYSFCSCALRCLSVCVLDHVSVVDSDRRGASGAADGGLLNTTPARQLPEGTVMLLGCIWSTSNLLSHFRTVYVSGKQWRIQNGGGEK